MRTRPLVVDRSVQETTASNDDLPRLERLMAMRRDVRHFSDATVPDEAIEKAIRVAALAPSVGYSQPWRWVQVDDPQRRATVIASHARANERARLEAHRERAEEYGALVLSGLSSAPVHLAVCCDTTTRRGSGLGRQTMPQTLRDSVVMAVYGFWLAARALDLGVGWVSILDPADVARVLDLPAGWDLVAYLAVGYAAVPSTTPELVERGWEQVDERSVQRIRR
jgi:5,6-dimethylbenzimidazole synthase